MEWITVFLCKYPEMQKKMFEEIQRTAGKRFAVMADHQVPYVTAFIKEVLRLQPPMTIVLPHRNAEEAVVHGYRIPKDTQVRNVESFDPIVELLGLQIILCPYATNRDSRYFEDPLTFSPERYLAPGLVDDDSNLTFGAGRRDCQVWSCSVLFYPADTGMQGKNFTLKILYYFTTHLVQSFELVHPTVDATTECFSMATTPAACFPKVSLRETAPLN